MLVLAGEADKVDWFDMYHRVDWGVPAQTVMHSNGFPTRHVPIAYESREWSELRMYGRAARWEQQSREVSLASLAWITNPQNFHSGTPERARL